MHRHFLKNQLLLNSTGNARKKSIFTITRAAHIILNKTSSTIDVKEKSKHKTNEINIFCNLRTRSIFIFKPFISSDNLPKLIMLS